MATKAAETKPEEKAPVLHEDVLALAKAIEKGMKLDKTSGVVTADEDLYKKSLPSELSMDTVKAVSDYNTKFVAAGAFAFGNIAIDAMKGNKKLERVTGEVSLGHRDVANYTLDRHRTFTNHLTGGGEQVDKYAVLTTGLEIRAGKNGGQLKQARLLIAEAGAKALKG